MLLGTAAFAFIVAYLSNFGRGDDEGDRRKRSRSWRGYVYLNHPFLEGTSTRRLLVCRPTTFEFHPLIVQCHLLLDRPLDYIATHMNGSFDATFADLDLLFSQWDRLLLFAGPGARFSGGRCGNGAIASSILDACISKCHRMVFLQHAHYTVGGFW